MFYCYYNGVQFELTRTLAFVRQPVYDQVSGSDYLYTRYFLDVEGVYNPEATSYLKIAPGGSQGFLKTPGILPPSTDDAVRAYLETPRGPLLYVLNGLEVLRSPLPGSATDVLDGPKPRLVQIREVSARTWIVRFQIETSINECDAQPGFPLLSHRFETTHSVGFPDHTTTIQYQGVAVFRKDELDAIGRNADDFRDLIFPRVSPWFQRKVITCRLSPLGNAIHYSIVDEEQHRSIGATNDARRHGVVDWDAVLTIQAQPGEKGGVVSEQCVGAIQGYAAGDRSSSRAGLLTWCVKLAIEKLRIAAGPVDPSTNNLLIKAEFSENLKRPQVFFSIAVLIPPGKQIEAGAGPVKTSLLGIDFVALFANDGTNPQMPGGNVRGHYAARALAQSLANACAPASTPDAAVCGYEGNPDAYLANADCFIDVAVGYPGLALQTTKYSNEQVNQGPMAFYSVDIAHIRDGARMACPVAGDGTEGPVILELGNAVCYREVSFVGERWGNKLPIPKPESKDLNERLVGSPTLVVSAPELMPDGQTLAYRAVGKYTYVRTDNRGPGDDGLWMGAVPWADFGFEDATNRVTIFEYRDGITGPSQTIA